MNITHVDQGFVIKDIVASKSGITVAKPIHRMHIVVFFLEKQHIYSYCLLYTYCTLTVHLPQDELTVLFAILRTAGMAVIT